MAETRRIYPSILKNLIVTRLNRVWTADITDIGIRNNFVCLAFILDLFDQRTIGHALSSNVDTALYLEVLKMAVVIRNPPQGVIHCSNREDYVEALFQYECQVSMSRKGIRNTHTLKEITHQYLIISERIFREEKKLFYCIDWKLFGKSKLLILKQPIRYQ